jgi:beta-ureidopropionase / N-carbamoyl-L-amino-acid hydrolase
MELAEFREPDQPGWTRRVFSESYMRSRAWTRDLMASAGLEVQTDAVGNLLGRLAGERPELPELVIGSHTDTVAGGGRFDGMVGVVAAVEVARLLSQTRRRLRRSLLVVDFLGEEPNRFGISCVGSAAVAGELGEPQLNLIDDQGETLAAALVGFDARPGDLADVLWPVTRLHGYLELHIEQGAQLERTGIRLGVVTSIAGIHRGVVTVVGRPDHAGTAAMGDRRDALAAAAEIVLLVERLASESAAGGEGVGTVGRLDITPGAPNVVPGTASVWVEFRSAQREWLEDRHHALESGVREDAARRQLQVEIEWVSEGSPVACAPGPRRAIVEAIEELGHPYLELPSGASHDAALLARICPMGMIFIPSRDGRSHCPEEWSDPEDVALGAEALLAAVLRLDLADSL